MQGKRLAIKIGSCLLCAMCSIMMLGSTTSAPSNTFDLNPATQASSNPASSPVEVKPSTESVEPQALHQIWNLQNADIRAVIQTISSLTGKNFVIDPRVQGKITIVSKKPMTVKELYQVFLSMLQVLGFAAVPSGEIIKIVPAMNAKEYAGTLIDDKGVAPVGDDNIVVRVIQVNNVSAAQMVPILRPLMHEWGTIMAYTPSNTLILAGSADNVQRLTHIIKNMDENNVTEIREVQLRFASASKLVPVLKQLQQDDRAEGKVTNVSFAADVGSNSILVSGNQSNIQLAMGLIHRLDTKAAGSDGGIEVVQLKYLDAKDTVPILIKLVHGETSGFEGGAAGAAGSGNAAASAASGADAGSGSDNPLAALSSGGNKDISIVAEKTSNSILIAAPAEVVSKLNRVIGRLDTRPKQVLVEAIIVQVDDSMLNKLGIQWGTLSDSSSSSSSSDSSSTSSSSSFDDFQQGVGFIKDVTIQGLLTALKNIANTNILATPSIVVLNNKEAVISDGVNVGLQNRQYATTDTGGGTTTGDDASTVPFTTTQRTDVTLKLTVTPQISPNQTVMLKIDQSNRQLDPSANNTNSENPTINTSEIKTNVLVNSGDILVLGGLIENQRKDTSSRVPILGDIPLIGRFFQYNTKDYVKKNLMVFLKPVILNTGRDNQRVSMERYNYIRGEEIRKAAGESLLSQTAPMLPGVVGGRPARNVALPPPFATH